MFGKKKKELPDIREPVIQVLRLIEEKPYHFDDLVGNFHFYESDAVLNYRNPPKRGKRVFSIHTSSHCMLEDGFEVIKIELENGTSVTNFTKDEKDLMDQSLRELEITLDFALEEQRIERQEESRQHVYKKLKSL